MLNWRTKLGKRFRLRRRRVSGRALSPAQERSGRHRHRVPVLGPAVSSRATPTSMTGRQLRIHIEKQRRANARKEAKRGSA